MPSLDKDYYRAANKGLFRNGVWKVENKEAAEGILYGDIERRYWTTTVVKKDGTRVREQRSRQDWSIKDGYVETGSGTSIYDYKGHWVISLGIISACRRGRSYRNR